MVPWMRSLWRLLPDEDGPTAVEYAVMLALIITFCLAAIGAIGVNTNGNFESLSSRLSSS
ncbi:MAG: Flp family type IVb pilin [Gemmataceae bacterium]|nr:Flp family type IVb pilin [Gemmataceae bacterium]MDW8266831.1 Flp family type IVb pilin [Gemmataceae bacterium]